MRKESNKPRKSRVRTPKTERKPESSPETAGTSTIQSKTKKGFPIVGIGASAGGLEALQELCEHIPLKCGMAFVIVQHLDPSHVSLMPELLSRCTTVPIHQIEDGVKIRKDRIYVNTANKNVGIFDSVFQLSEPVTQPGPKFPIDFFFRSLARDQGPNAVAVVLSGTGSDGTLGVRSIKEEAGLIIVEDPDSARYNGMPRNAIATNLVDIVLVPSEIPRQLHELTKNRKVPYLETTEFDAAPLQQIFAIMRRLTKHDFSQYKEATIRRRLERRMSLHKTRNITDYVHFLEDNPEEANALFKDILISVTSFFRDPQAFSTLEANLLKLLSTRSHDEAIRAWIPGCSTGEEAYSVAITIRECLEKLGMENEVQIFGTDVDADSIETARIGTYPIGIAADVSPERLRKYFTKSDSNYTVKKDLRESLVFAVQDITKDPPFSKVDIVCCRNLLIYMNAGLQKVLLPFFHYALNKNGILFLGPSETASAFPAHFTTLDKKWKIYERIETPDNNALRFPPVSSHDRDGVLKNKPAEKKIAEMNLPEYVQRNLLTNYTPAGIVIDQNQNILYVHGETGKYLQLPQGPMTANVSEMGREGIKNELASAVRKAINTDTDVTYEHLQLKQDGGFGLVNLIIKRLTPPQESRKLYLIIFQDVVTIEKEALDVTKRQTKRAVDDRIAELDRELKSTRENLQTTVEELETSNEELKSANEELQSTNEELQSTNEELETSREELQSVNEELLTVNAEHQTKIEELSKSNDDIKNFLDVTMVAIILLDSNLCIRRYTVETTKIFNIISSDIGRPIRHITSRIKYDNLVQDAEQVLDTLTPKVMEVQTEEGHWYNMNILPYRTTENVISGIVITFMDIGNIKKAAEEATARELAEKKVDEEKAARELAEAIVDTVREPLMVLNGDLRVISANQSFYDVFKVSVKETIGQFVYDLGNKQWDIQRLRHLLEDVLPRDSSFKDFEVEYDFLNIGHRKMLLNARKVQQHLGKKGLILLAIEDITDKK